MAIHPQIAPSGRPLVRTTLLGGTHEVKHVQAVCDGNVRRRSMRSAGEDPSISTRSARLADSQPIETEGVTMIPTAARNGAFIDHVIWRGGAISRFIVKADA